MAVASHMKERHTAINGNVTDAECINGLFGMVRKEGYVKTAERINVVLGYRQQTGDELRNKQLVSCWNYVLKQK